jgi:DNA-binding NarL/FixJ family response regulator
MALAGTDSRAARATEGRSRSSAPATSHGFAPGRREHRPGSGSLRTTNGSRRSSPPGTATERWPPPPSSASRSSSGTAEAALQATSALAADENGAGEEPRRVVLCSDRGVIEFASPSSRALLERYLAIDKGRVAAGVLRRRTLLLAQGERQLHIRIARTGALCVLLLDERHSRMESLTTRERQILEHVALGQQNDAIGLQLGIAPATIAKHLEHVYRKLDVPNRTAAAALLNPPARAASTDAR